MAASWLFEKENTALIFNADSLLKPNLQIFISKHKELVKKYGIEATLALMAHPDAGKKYNAFALNGDLIQVHVKADRKNSGAFFHFPGLYLVEKKLMSRLPPAGVVSDIVELAWKPAIAEKKLGAWIYAGFYQDLGTPADLAKAEKNLSIY